MSFSIQHRGELYAVDVIAAFGVSRVAESGTGHDAGTADLPVDFLDRIADQLVADWAADCCTVPTPSERHLARRIVRALLPDPDSDEQGVETVLRRMWTQPGRAAA